MTSGRAGIQSEAKGVDELHPVHVALALEEVRVEVGVGETVTRAEGLKHARQRADEPRHHPREGRHIAGLVAIDQYLGIAVG